MSKILRTYENPTSEKHLEKCSDILKNGGVIAYPSDVNWAFGCLAYHKKALNRLYNLKHYPDPKKPFSLIFSDFSMLANYANIDNKSFRILKKILPGPYTIIISSHKKLPKLLKQHRLEIGIRIPKRPLITELIKMTQAPIASCAVEIGKNNQDKNKDSENLIIRPETAFEIETYFNNKIDLILDLQTNLSYSETTILKIANDDAQIQLIRLAEGAVDFLKN